MDNALFPSQIPVKRLISVEDDTSDLCNNTTAAQPRALKIQAGRLQNHVQDGRPMDEFLLAATKETEVKPHDDITFVYWSE